MKKLGIVVPTYNRVNILKSTLDAIVKQLLPFIEKVSLVICDNASQDGTDLFMNEFIKEYPFAKYYRHNYNQGYLYNFKFGIEHSDAEYVFLHGDDDLVTPYTISTLLNYIEEYPEVGLFHFNYFVSDLNKNPFRLIYNHFDDNANVVYYNFGKDFIMHHFDLPSFMSSLVFRKDLWLKAVNDEKQYDCIAYEWLYVLYRGILESKCIFIPFPLFVQRLSKFEGYSVNWTLYSIIGISRVFENLGDDIYLGWKAYRKRYSKPKMLRNITAVYRDKTLYRSKYKELNQYIDGFLYKFVLFITLFVVPASVTKFLFEKVRNWFVG